MHTVKHKPTSINEPSHHLATSLLVPIANRWWMFCMHLRWYLSGCCGLKSVLWMSIIIYNKSGQSVAPWLWSVQLPWSIYDSYFKRECRLWKTGSLMKSPQNAGKCPSEHPHLQRPKSHTHSFCHPSLSDACFYICLTKYWKKNNAQYNLS